MVSTSHVLLTDHGRMVCLLVTLRGTSEISLRRNIARSWLLLLQSRASMAAANEGKSVMGGIIYLVGLVVVVLAVLSLLGLS